MDIGKQIIIKDLKERLSTYLKGSLKAVILFGSQLTETNSVESDFDILIVIKGNIDWKLERSISDICYDVELKYGIVMDSHILSETDLSSPRGKQPIFFNALHQGFYA